MFLDNPGQNHWVAGKRVLRYLQGTMRIGLSFQVCLDFSLTGFSDADYAADTDTRGSTTGYCFKLGETVVCWATKRQASVALSTFEAE